MRPARSAAASSSSSASSTPASACASTSSSSSSSSAYIQSVSGAVPRTSRRAAPPEAPEGGRSAACHPRVPCVQTVRAWQLQSTQEAKRRTHSSTVFLPRLSTAARRRNFGSSNTPLKRSSISTRACACRACHGRVRWLRLKAQLARLWEARKTRVGVHSLEARVAGHYASGCWRSGLARRALG